jgi:hypothetical protein
MRRLEISELFHGNKTVVVDEPWKGIKDILPQEESTKIYVKSLDGSAESAFYYADGAVWQAKFGYPTGYFWSCKTKLPIKDVTHWKAMKEEESITNG